MGVDNWEYTSNTPQQREKCLRNLEASGSPATMLEMDSVEAAKIVAGPLAFVFIDGDHQYSSVKQDIELWTTKIMPGGIAAFHDYGAKRHPGVKQAIDEWQAKAQWKSMGEIDYRDRVQEAMKPLHVMLIHRDSDNYRKLTGWWSYPYPRVHMGHAEGAAEWIYRNAEYPGR